MVHHYNNPRSMQSGSQLSAAGLTAGIPDLVLYIANLQFHGLFIELKMPGENPRIDQLEYMDALSTRHYCVAVAHTLEEFQEVIKGYLSLS